MGRRRGWHWSTEAERAEIRRRVATGERIDDIAASVGRSKRYVQTTVSPFGGIQPRPTRRSALRLSNAEREEISRGLRAGETLRLIARQLGRAPSTVSREVGANGGRQRYRAVRAEARASRAARRPRAAKLASNRRLRAAVERLLLDLWSPQQIAWQLRHDHPDDPEMWVSHETIYQSLFVQGRGALRNELHRCLRTGRARRRPAGRATSVGHISDMVMISERPAEVEDRAVPGHWEGDLIIGKATRSAIGTLVERQTRYVMLFSAARRAHRRGRQDRPHEQHPAAARRTPPSAHLGPRQGDGRARSGSPSTPASPSTSAIPTAPGSAAATRTPTACSASTSPRAPTSPSTAKPNSTPSPQAQRPTSTNARLDDTIRGTRQAVAMTD